MILSKTCIYGIRAVIYIASHEADQFIPIKKVADDLTISFHFLTKILQILTQKGILTSYRGPNGGISLAKNAGQINIYEIVLALDCSGIFSECLLGLPGCGVNTPCPLHYKWEIIRENLKSVFREVTVLELAGKLVKENLRISENELILKLLTEK